MTSSEERSLTEDRISSLAGVGVVIIYGGESALEVLLALGLVQRSQLLDECELFDSPASAAYELVDCPPSPERGEAGVDSVEEELEARLLNGHSRQFLIQTHQSDFRYPSELFKQVPIWYLLNQHGNNPRREARQQKHRPPNRQRGRYK